MMVTIKLWIKLTYILNFQIKQKYQYLSNKRIGLKVKALTLKY